MSEATVRAAVVAYIKSGNITGMQDVYNDEPWFLDGGKWSLKDNGGWGAISFVHIDNSVERRVASGGQVFTGPTPNMPTGSKMVIYTISLVIQYQYLIPAKLPANTREDAWVASIDTILVDVKKLMRADPTFGTSGQGDARPIWQAAQGNGQGGDHIRQTRDLPVTNPERTKVLNWNRIEFDAIEFITA